MKKLIVGVAAALSLIPGNALADGTYRRPPPTIAAPVPEPPPLLSWTGLYIGAGIGAGALVNDITVDDDVFGRILNTDGVGAHGVLGTVIVGWDWQISPKTVLGVFADFDWSNISNDHSIFDDFFRHSIDHNGTWAIGARLGWLSSPSVLWYLNGGYTQADFDVSSQFAGLAPFSGDQTLNGWFVGGGVDTRLAATNWFLRLEYRFSQFDSETVFSPDGLTSVDFEPSMHTARLTLTYKFGGGYGYGYGWGWPNWGQ